MNDIEKIDAVMAAAKVLRSSLQRRQRLAERPYSRKTSTDQAWLGMAIEKERHQLHIAVVLAEAADPYPDDRYGHRFFKPDGWHEYRELFEHPFKRSA